MSAALQWDEADLVALQSDLLRFARIQTGNAETSPKKPCSPPCATAGSFKGAPSSKPGCSPF